MDVDDDDDDNYYRTTTLILSSCGSDDTQDKEEIHTPVEIGLTWGVKNDLKRIYNTVKMIESVTNDTKKKQVRDSSVRLWIKRLKRVKVEDYHIDV
ncbi:hypothetical protein C5167_049234 [Papaver somniferum]|uniref:Disease resistance N-terminal domain-containing protein n=1 Tax=Papaver somniferum TaxID=3469 RepID=A0A4Y7KK88_PAPSO|nr:hypothetical protein C5167_049234 [Papaver somniferum]